MLSLVNAFSIAQSSTHQHDFIDILSRSKFDHTNEQRHHSKHSKSSLYDKHAMKRGLAGFIPHYSVHGAIIMSDRGEHGHILATNSTTAGGLSQQQREKLQLISARLHNVQRLESVLPFELTQWPAAFTSPCPIQPDSTHKSERGLLWAHYRIWREFIYFDQELLEMAEAAKAAADSTDGAAATWTEPLTSADGVYAAYPNGTLFKDTLPFRDRDILVVFEDDADCTIRRANYTLQQEFKQMNTDLLFLGWCDGRLARPVPLCAHAYAVTRSGARKLVQNWEPCGKAVDEQFVIMAKNNFITWRKVSPASYSNTNKRYPVHGDKTFGIFHQNKWELGSFIGH